LVSHRR